MSDAPTPNGQSAEAKAPSLRVLTQYVKDLSFENPNAPQSLRNDLPAPKVDVGLDVRARAFGDNHYESSVSLRVSAKRDDQVSFLCEVEYAGLFVIENVPQDAVEPVLMIDCPRMLFPFARRVVSDAIRDGGFPPLMLEPIDFMQIYRSRREAKETAAGGAA